MNHLQPWPYPNLIAHRGAGKLAPENTLAAIRLGHHYGYRMAEFDVKLSLDKVAILLHDSDLDRTTNGKGAAALVPIGGLIELDAGSWHSKAYAGEPIATLLSIANYLKANDMACNIEIKPSPGQELETGKIVAELAAKFWADAAIKPLLSSFSYDSLVAAKKAAPELPRAYLSSELPTHWRGILEGLECIAIHLSHKAVTLDTVELIRQSGWRLAVWTVNDPEQVSRLMNWGVDSVITDAVDIITPYVIR